MDQQLTKAIDQVRRRMFYITLRQSLFTGLCIGLGLGLLVLLLSRFVTIAEARWFAIGITVLSGISGWVWAWLHRPSTQDAVRLMDNRGLEDRMSTALTYWEADSILAEIVKKQAAEQSAVFLREIPTRVPYPKWSYRAWGNAALSVIFVFLLLWPNPMDEVLAKKNLEEDWIAEQKETVENWLEEENLERQDDQNPPVEDWVTALQDLKASLEDMERAEEALQQIEETLKELQDQAERMEQDISKGEQLLEDWNKALEQGVSPEALREAYRESSDPLERELAEQIGTEDPLKEAQETLQDLMEESEKLQEIARQMAESGLPMAQELAAQGAAASSFWGSGGAAESISSGSPNSADGSSNTANEGDRSGEAAEGSSGSSPNSGEGSGSGEGSDSGEGTGASQGSGEGSASGSGSGQGSGMGQGSGAGRGSTPLELLTVPEQIDGESNTEVDSGPLDGEGGETETGGKAPALDGQSKSYEQVYREYETQASQTVDRGTLPQHMKQMVRDYFLEIQPDITTD